MYPESSNDRTVTIAEIDHQLAKIANAMEALHETISRLNIKIDDQPRAEQAEEGKVLIDYELFKDE
jgi:hypothetical protein